MLYDLNIPWSSSTPPNDLQRTLSFLSELGYDTIALNHTLSTAVPSQIVNPIPTTFPFVVPPKTTLLRRCTLTISDPSQNHRLSALASAYDILALRPTTEKAYLAACLSLNEHSLLSLDLTQHYPFPFKQKNLMTAINRGVMIEICYSQATMGDAAKRRNFIGNFTSVARATKGRGIVVSSEARSVLGLRGPADVLNLLGVWGLARERGLDAMGSNARAVVVNEGLKRSSFRGVVDVIEGGERPKAKEKENTAKSGENNAAAKKGKGKRPAEENVEGTPQISKRQKKKMRLEALAAEKAGQSPSGGTPVTSNTPQPPDGLV